MGSDRTRTLTIDEDIAVTIERRAADLGVSPSEFLASAISQGEPIESDASIIAELDARWDRVAKGEAEVVPHDRVVRWLRTWGQPDFKPWSESH